VASAGDEREGREFDGGAALAGFEQDGLNVAFDVVDGDEGDVGGEGDGFGVGEADEESARESGARCGGDGAEIGPGSAGTFEGFADHRDDCAEMFAGGEFGDDAAVSGVEFELAGDDVREDARTVFEDGGGGFVAGAFDCEEAGQVPM